MNPKKSLSLLLAIVMIISLLPIALFLVTDAESSPAEKNITLGAAHIQGEQVSNVYFGNYSQSNAGGTAKDPIKWRVLSNGDGKLFLLADQNLDVVSYHKEYEAVTWETSTIRSWLNGLASNKGNGDNAINYGSDNFLDHAFSAGEQIAVADTVLVNKDNGTYGTDGGNGTTDKVFLLSYEDVRNTAYGFTNNDNNTDTRVAINTAYVAAATTGGETDMNGVGNADYWWLRSPGCGTDYAVIVTNKGSVYSGGEIAPYISVAVRPALNINTAAVLFTSAAKGGKSSTGIVENVNITTLKDSDGYKLTLLDSGRSGFQASLGNLSGNIATISYSGAKTGSNEYISAIVRNGDTVKYYGRLGLAQTSGTQTVSLPDDFSEENGDVLCVFNEQYNGDYKTDYASKLIEIPVATENQWVTTPTISGWTYGSAPSTPKGAAKFGNVVVTYMGTTNSGSNYAETTTPPTEAGNYKAIFTVAETSNYNGLSVTKEFTISKATLTVTAENKAATYGDKAPAYTVTYSGFKGNDTKASLGGALAFECGYEQFKDKGEYTITPKGYESGNYNFKYVGGKLTVNAKSITVTIEAKTSVYGNEIVALTASDNGIVNQDVDVYKLSTTATKTAGVGKYDVTGTALDGNYSITFAKEKDAYEITARELTVDVQAADKQYDGLNTATISSAKLNDVVNGDQVGLVKGTATFESVNAANNIGILFTDFALSGDAGVLKNYTLKQPTGVKASITNNWSPVEYTVCALNTNGWTNKEFVVTPDKGYTISLTNTADGNWNTTLTGAVEGSNSSITFYLRRDTDGAISLAKTESYKLDHTAPSGTVSFDERSRFETFLNTITFGLFYKDEVTVKAQATDALSGVASIEYFASHKGMTMDEVKAVTGWTVMPEKGVGVTLEDEKQFVYYVRITDNAGNVTYLSTDGAQYDTSAPVVEGVEDGGTYYTAQTVTVTDPNLEAVTLNGETATGTITLEGDVDATYTIVATDKAGNTTTVTVTMKKDPSAPSGPSEPSNSGGEVLPYGDINEDGSINAADALLALKIAVNKYEPTLRQVEIGDVSNDGAVNSTDALQILQYIVGKLKVFPVVAQQAGVK